MLNLNTMPCNIIANSNQQAAIARHWPLFLPILLSLAEDISTAVRAKGLKILLLFLDKCPPNTILSAGVDNVIQDAVFPTLLFLPDTTPESESLQLLYPAYQVLLRVAQLDPNPKSAKRRKALDRILRDGVFTGHFHASQHVRIVEVLMIVIKDIVSCMGLFSAKYLQVKPTSHTLSRPQPPTCSVLINQSSRRGSSACSRLRCQTPLSRNTHHSSVQQLKR